MLKKLLEYDLKWCFKPLLPFYILALFFSVSIRILESFEQSLMILIIDKICCGALFSMLISIIINCLMRNWARFVKNVYKDEAYLTHTLAVSKNKIYLSKVLATAIILFVSLVIIIACLAISILNADTWSFLKLSIEQTAMYFNCSIFSFAFVTATIVFFELLFIALNGILGIIIGHRSNNLKMLKSIIAGFVIYMTLSLTSLGILYVAGLLNSDIMPIFNNIEVSSSAIKSVMLICTLVYAVYNVIIYYVSSKLLNKGVNID